MADQNKPNPADFDEPLPKYPMQHPAWASEEAVALKGPTDEDGNPVQPPDEQPEAVLVEALPSQEPTDKENSEQIREDRHDQRARDRIEEREEHKSGSHEKVDKQKTRT